MFELNAMGNYVLVMVICLVFIMILLSRQKRTGKDVTVWLFAGIVGVMLGVAGTLAAITLTNHQIVDGYEMAAELVEEDEDGDSGEGGGGGRGGRGGGRGSFDPAAIFAERDADGDGKLTGDEISERMAASLAEIDTDGDGAVTLEEFQARMQARSGRGGRGQRGGGAEGGAESEGADGGAPATDTGDSGTEESPPEGQADSEGEPESEE
jgi:hypothetical protein